MADVPDLSWIAAGYQTNLTTFTPGASPGVKVLKADARRWYMNITMPSSGLGTLGIFPGGSPASFFPPGILNTAFGLELTFGQAPGMIGLEWWVVGNGTTRIWVTEILKVA